LATGEGLSIARACAAVRLSRAAYYRPARDWREGYAEVIAVLNALIERHARWGFWKCYDRTRLDGYRINHKRLYRVYRLMKLNLPRRGKKRLPLRTRIALEAPAIPNRLWALDFMSDSLYSGRCFRLLNLLDEGMREGLAIEVDTSIPALRVIRVLENVCAWRGYPNGIRCDNGPEFISEAFVTWCTAHGITIQYIQPGKPNQNAFIERYNRTLRNEVLDLYLLETLDEVREATHQFLIDYNERRPHDALNGLPPSVFRERLLTAESSTSELSA
jgi:putative transposase